MHLSIITALKKPTYCGGMVSPNWKNSTGEVKNTGTAAARNRTATELMEYSVHNSPGIARLPAIRAF